MHKLITNDGKSPMYHGNTMIPPGESRLVEVAGEAAAPTPAAGPTLPEQLAILLAGTIAVIKPELEGMTNEGLDLAYQLEEAGLKRSTLLAAIDAERLHRADQRLQLEQQQQAQAALDAAREELLSAKVALINQPPDAPAADREAAEAAVAEAQAKVDALTPEE